MQELFQPTLRDPCCCLQHLHQITQLDTGYLLFAHHCVNLRADFQHCLFPLHLQTGFVSPLRHVFLSLLISASLLVSFHPSTFTYTPWIFLFPHFFGLSTPMPLYQLHFIHHLGMCQTNTSRPPAHLPLPKVLEYDEKAMKVHTPAYGFLPLWLQGSSTDTAMLPCRAGSCRSPGWCLSTC